MTVLLDTSIIIDYFRDIKNARNLLENIFTDGKAKISLITYAELLSGSYRATNPEKERDRIKSFINDFSIEIVLLDIETIKIYAEIKFLLENKGQKIDEFDLLIAATAKQHNSPLATSNTKHFQRIPNLKVTS